MIWLWMGLLRIGTPNGVDLTLVRWMMSLTPDGKIERSRFLPPRHREVIARE